MQAVAELRNPMGSWPKSTIADQQSVRALHPFSTSLLVQTIKIDPERTGSGY